MRYLIPNISKKVEDSKMGKNVKISTGEELGIRRKGNFIRFCVLHNNEYIGIIKTRLEHLAEI